ncbi:MAG: M14 family metallopeptidase [Candidatus Aminicenantales bacterium]
MSPINKKLLGLSLIFIFLFALGYGHLRAARVELSFDHFYDHAELTRALKALQNAYPQLMTLRSIGMSSQGRDIWVAILSNPKTGPAEHKPGYYIDGNIHGNEIQGAEVALYVIWYLLNNYGRTELATRLLDERVFYVVPTMNPDSRDYYINLPSDPNSPRSGLMPYDSDRDGLADEDGPEDLDGDGSITMMRKRDPNGTHKPHPDDPRILIPVKPGEKGGYILLGQEGIDNDGDGLINEDGPGGYDMNRNYGYNWQPDYVQRGAGDYPFCFPETQAVRDFLLAHPNIAGAQNFHNFGGMILRGPGAKNMGEYNPADRRVYDYIGKKGEKILPGYRYITIYKDMYTVYGGSVDFLYAGLGIFTFSNELDMDPLAEQRQRTGKGEEEESEDVMSMLFQEGRLEEMVYHDLVLLGEQFSDWKPYKHPLYGDIEIGGVKKFGRRVPPPFKLAETCHRNAAFCLYHADQLARLEIEPVGIRKVKGDLFEVDVALTNSRPTPSMAAVAVQNKLHRADQFKVAGPRAELLAAGQVVDKFLGWTKKIKTRANAFWVEGGVPGFGRLEFRLLVKGSGKIELIYDSLKGGYRTRSVVLE